MMICSRFLLWSSILSLLPLGVGCPSALSNWGATRALALEIMAKGRVERAELREKYRPFGILDAAGRSLPVIEEGSNGNLYRKSKQLASATADAFLRGVDLARLAKALHVTSRREALVIAYHEWMWELVDLLEREGIVRRPVAFSAPQRASRKDIGDLMFLVRRVRSAAPK